MMTMSDIHQLDPDGPNNWADPDTHYIVEVRPPKIGEWYLSGAKIYRSDHNYRHVQQCVIVGIAGQA